MTGNKKNNHEVSIDDVNFILDECVRLATLSSTGIKNIPPMESLWTLPHPSGSGSMICGRAAKKRLADLSLEALRRSGLERQITVSTISKPLESLFVRWFIKDRRLVERKQVDRLLSAAAKQAKTKLVTETYFIPCHLMGTSSKDLFTIGPITFHDKNSFRKLLLKNSPKSKQSKQDAQQHERSLLAKAILYYRNFQWIAEVTISNCDKKTSSEVSVYAVTAALNCLHLLLGFKHTGRMRVGGFALKTDKRAELKLCSQGKLKTTLTYAYFGHVEYPENWSEILDTDRWKSWSSLLNILLEAAVNPQLRRPLSIRFLDAVQWFGEACRDESASTRTIKFITAVERLLTTGEHDNVSRMIEERTANLCLMSGANRQEWKAKARKAYNYRSELLHGSMSPRDEEAMSGAYLAAEVAQEVMLSALNAFSEKGLLSETVNEISLIEWFNELEIWANALEAKSIDIDEK